jgi:molecular chaperone GrpE
MVDEPEDLMPQDMAADAKYEAEPAGEEAAGWVEVELYEQACAERDRYLRAVADAETRARRGAEQARVGVQRANEDFLVALMPVLTGFQRAVSAFQDGASPEGMAEGLEMLARQLSGFLESIGATVIEPAVGEPFDPDRHEAVYGQPATDEVPEGHVTLVVDRGVALAGRVVRPARVAVASAALDTEA